MVRILLEFAKRVPVSFTTSKLMIQEIIVKLYRLNLSKVLGKITVFWNAALL